MSYQGEIKNHIDALYNKTGKGNDYLGWVNLPSTITFEEIEDINNTANSLKEKCEVVVIVGIGGSYLGTEFVYEALKGLPVNCLNLLFLANVDIDNFGAIIQDIEAEETLWVIISKSYTTSETLLNKETVFRYLASQDLDSRHHVVNVTAKGSPGDTGNSQILKSFYMFDFIVLFVI